MKKMRLASLVLVAATIGGSISANAIAATPHKKGETCSSFNAFNYDCPSLGKGITIDKIYELGYRVVTAIQIQSGMTRLIVEEQ